ncbi:unnamed protein product [Acanthoscelides obtectus]|uniref:ALMS motif domain-containing protein n=1 Tax=Acanthoscelides obtectus TaxID=200917 RepID=A0A9P0M9P2_ACAOB|nr:unnamed protein product [Acanthoscelides obtectus]CAK1645209.1 hypothetical protein AOBTE_LOCUS14058 [Acanthoscelides obtectus]
MASGSKDDEEAISTHVLEYYQRFSRNRHLPRYFSGSSVSYLPEIRGESDSEHELRENPLIVISCAEKGETSRASSDLSNKKLEWDNGADIGYENCEATKLKRTSSLPALLDIPKSPHVSFDTDQSSSSGSELKIIIVESSSENNAGKPKSSTSSLCEEEKKLLSSSSSASNIEKKVHPSSSSGSSKQDEKLVPASSSHTTSSSTRNILDFMGTLSYLKQKIGLPDAHSTPHEDSAQKNLLAQYLQTPILPNTKKPVRRLSEQVEALKNDEFKDSKTTVNSNQKVEVMKNEELEDSKTVTKPSQKVVTLCLTKPISVECTGEQKTKSEKAATVKQSTVAIQTDEISEKELIKIIARSQNSLNQSVLYYKHADNKNESSSQTGSNVMGSNCDSFEYISGRNASPKNNDSSEGDVESEKLYVDVKKSAGQHKLETLNASSDSQSSENCLGNEEVEKSIHLLQKLIKSKKYDPATKKRYIKKLIKKISESKFMEESSTSSDLFYPKKSEIPKNLQQNTPSTETSSEPLQKPSLHPTDFSWIPASKPPSLSPRKKSSDTDVFHQKNLKSSPREKQSQANIFHQEKKRPSKSDVCYQDVHVTENLTSPTEIIPVDARDMRKNLFTLTNNEFSVNKDTESSKSKSSDNASLEKNYQSASSLKSYQDWKDDKTVSEKMFEAERFAGDGDYLTNWASKERAYQINWINNEISHLGKLKNLLENIPNEPEQSGTSSGSRSSASHKTTSVYRVSEQNVPPGERKPKKYVIQTQFGPKDGEPRGYMLDGKKYIVEEDNMASRPRQVLGDIEIVSSDTTMNIKVTTFCETCKKSPCICNVESQAKVFVAETGKETRDAQSSEICITCHKSPCVCPKNTGAIRKKCSECNLYPCGCVIRKDSYFGEFIPAKSPGPSTSSKICPKYKESAEQYNSLKRVFENCSCTSTEGTCAFVQKLVKHFDVGQTIPIQCSFGPKYICKNATMQAQVEVRSGGDKQLQTDKKVHFSQARSQRDMSFEIDNRQVDSKSNQTNRRELGDQDEATATNTVDLVENVAQTNVIQSKSRAIQSEQAKIIETKTQTDSSAFNLKDEASNTFPQAAHQQTGSQTEPTNVKNQATGGEVKAMMHRGIDAPRRPEYHHVDIQHGCEKADQETMACAPENLSYELVVVEPLPVYTPPVLREVSDEAVNTTPRENVDKGTQSDAKQTLERVVSNVRDAGVNNNGQIHRSKATIAYQFPESEKRSKNQAVNVLQDVDARESQTDRAERDIQIQTQTKDAVKATQTGSQNQRVAQTTQIPQEHQQGVQVQILKENAMKNTQGVQVSRDQDQGTQVNVLTPKGSYADFIEPKVPQSAQTPQVQNDGSQASYIDQRASHSVQAPHVHGLNTQATYRYHRTTRSVQDVDVQTRPRQGSLDKSSQGVVGDQGSSFIQIPVFRDSVTRTIQTKVEEQYAHTQTQNMLHISVKATQPSERYQQEAQSQTVGVRDPANKAVQAERYETIGQSQTEKLRVSSIAVQPLHDLQKVGGTQTVGTRGSASKVVQVGETQAGVPKFSASTGAHRFEKDGQTQTSSLGHPVDGGIRGARQYQTQTSEDGKTSRKVAQALAGQKSVDTQTQPKGGSMKEIELTTYTDVKVQANTYPRSTSGKKIKFVGSDSEVSKLQSSLKGVGCMCACRTQRVRKTSSEGSEQATRRVKTMKNKRIETDRERGRVKILDERASEPETAGRKRATMKSKSVETEKRTIGTCRCGFTDRVYLEDEAAQKRKTDNPDESSYRHYSASSNGTTETTTTSTPRSYTIPPSLLTCICCDRRTTSDNWA